ncbi:MAG: N-(5'-phosphoribosyl)anthranilate isomerase [Candidatus Rokuibacteriota bacterium]|nr:MAG: N-(5'-phosphoribosyl)anthranilate isomerase [Candidatus Rokubacteria bacterium]
MIRVKICGITNVQDAMTAVDAGADALGFIFVEGTPRFVTPEQVAPIVRRLPPFVTPVGVFWDHPTGHVKAVAEACGLRALQFHGQEPPEDLTGFSLPVIKTIKLPPASTIDGLPEYRVREQTEVLRYRGVAAAILLDSAARWSEGEKREPIEWRLAGRLDASRTRLILSGGLHPNNVARAIEIARPYGVDVNSGVEAEPGRKDPEKVRRFVSEARRVG